MSNFKKWLGGGVGWMLGGPIGGLLGFAFGSLLDTNIAEEITKEANYSSNGYSLEADFRISLLLLSAFVIKSDGNASKEELEYVRNFFAKRFGAEKANSSMRIFNRLDKSKSSIEEVCQHVRTMLDYSSRLQLVHFLFSVAQADGSMTREETGTIKRIATLFGLHETEFDSIAGMFEKPSTERAYHIIGVSKNDSFEVIKKAYRKLTLQYHPDKVAHLGEDVQQAAKEKYQSVLEAYETIKKQRGET